MISANNISLSCRQEHLFEDVNIKPSGRRQLLWTGSVQNGAGKSHIFKDPFRTVIRANLQVVLNRYTIDVVRPAVNAVYPLTIRICRSGTT